MAGRLASLLVGIFGLLMAGGVPAAGGMPAESLARALAAEGTEATGALATLDPRLDAPAARLCSLASSPRTLPDGEEFAVVRTALWAAGVGDFEFTWRRVLFRGVGDVAALAGRLSGEIPGVPYTHLGAALVPDEGKGGCAAVVWTRRRAFPRGPLPGVEQAGWGRLDLTLARGLERPRVVVTLPGGGVQAGRITADGGGWIAEYPWVPGDRPQRVEILAEGDSGTEVLLLFQVGAPGEAPAGGMDGAEPRDAGEAEKALLGWIAAERAGAGLPPLAEAAPLRAAALGHSEAMREGGFFGHVDPARGTLVERLGAQGVLYSLATENVARTASIAVAHDCFMASPGHRGNVLDPRATHVGLGVVREGGAWWVTEVFARVLPAGDGDGIRSAVLERIAAVRGGAGLPPLTERRVLSDLAQEIAEEAAREGRPTLVREEAGRGLGERVRFALPWAGRVAAGLVVADTPLAVGSAGHVLDRGFSQVGVGLARGPGPLAEGGRRVGDGLLWVVLVLAGRDQEPTP